LFFQSLESSKFHNFNFSSEAFDHSKLLHFIENSPIFTSIVFFEAITHAIHLETIPHFNFGLNETSSLFTRIVHNFFSFLKSNNKLSKNVDIFLHFFFKLCIETLCGHIQECVQMWVGEEEKKLVHAEFTPSTTNEIAFIDDLFSTLLDIFPNLILIFQENFDEFFDLSDLKIWNHCLVFGFFTQFKKLNNETLENLSKESSFVNFVSGFYQKMKIIHQMPFQKTQKNEFMSQIDVILNRIPSLKGLLSK
jgi:hypothetical protein